MSDFGPMCPPPYSGNARKKTFFFSIDVFPNVPTSIGAIRLSLRYHLTFEAQRETEQQGDIPQGLTH